MQKNSHTRSLKEKKIAVGIIILAAFFILLDTFFKRIAILAFTGNEFIPPGNIFTFGLHKNTGIAFDTQVPLEMVIVLSTIIILSMIIFCIKSWQSKQFLISAFSATLILGALGNMIDRIINQFTTDYLIFFRLSALNIADILIITSTILLLYYSKYKDTTIFTFQGSKH